MAQFDLHGNTNPTTRRRTPYLLDTQSDMVSSLPTRIVCPVRPRAAMKGDPIDRVHLALTLGGQEFVVFMTELAAVPCSLLGPIVTSAAYARREIVAAVDLLITGF